MLAGWPVIVDTDPAIHKSPSQTIFILLLGLSLFKAEIGFAWVFNLRRRRRRSPWVRGMVESRFERPKFSTLFQVLKKFEDFQSQYASTRRIVERLKILKQFKT
jgi:hypothetical protein